MHHPRRSKTQLKTVSSSCRALSLPLLQWEETCTDFLTQTGFGWIPNIKSNPIPASPTQFKTIPNSCMLPRHPPCVIISSAAWLLILDILAPTWRREQNQRIEKNASTLGVTVMTVPAFPACLCWLLLRSYEQECL